MNGTRTALARLRLPLFALCGVALYAQTLPAQTPMLTAATTLNLPDAPTPQATQSTTPAASQDGVQTRRILGIVPNFRSVSAGTKLPPQTVKDKFKTASLDAFDYSSLVVPLVLAGEQQANNSTPEFHQGAAGYARYFWHDYADQDIETFMVEFIVPVAHHEDTRYYTLGKGGFWKRTGYALSRTVITRSDSGDSTVNLGEIIGAGAAAGVSETYYPTRQRSFGNTADKWGTNVGIDAATFFAKEFWPDINQKFFHGKQ